MLASTAALFLALASAAPPASWSASIGASAGYATTLSYFGATCAVGGDCRSVFAQGLAGSLSGRALYGQSIRIGASVEITGVAGAGHGLSTSLLAAVRFGNETFLDVGGGAAYVWAALPRAGDGFKTEGGFGPAAELRGGASIGDEVWLTGSVRTVFALPDGVTAAVLALGLEWRL